MPLFIFGRLNFSIEKSTNLIPEFHAAAAPTLRMGKNPKFGGRQSLDFGFFFKKFALIYQKSI